MSPNFAAAAVRRRQRQPQGGAELSPHSASRVEALAADSDCDGSKPKNALSPQWDYWILRQEPFTLSEAARVLGIKQDRRTKRIDPDEIDSDGSRGGLTRRIAAYAGNALRDAGGPEGYASEAAYIHDLVSYVLTLRLSGKKGQAAKAFACKIAAKFWKNFDPARVRKARPHEGCMERSLRQRGIKGRMAQAEAGRTTAGRRRKTTFEFLKEEYHRLRWREKGIAPTQEQLAESAGKSTRTVQRYWTDITGKSKTSEHDTRSLKKSSGFSGLCRTLHPATRQRFHRAAHRAASIAAWLAWCYDTMRSDVITSQPEPVRGWIAEVLPGCTVSPPTAKRISSRIPAPEDGIDDLIAIFAA